MALGKSPFAASVTAREIAELDTDLFRLRPSPISASLKIGFKTGNRSTSGGCGFLSSEGRSCGEYVDIFSKLKDSHHMNILQKTC